MSNNNIRIVHNDCFDELIKLDNNSIDCVITSPPYFIDKLDNNWCPNDIKEDKKNSHIKHLPKGMKFDKNQVKKLYDFYLKSDESWMSNVANGAPGGKYSKMLKYPRIWYKPAGTNLFHLDSNIRKIMNEIS